MKIRYQNGEWWKFADNGEGINRVKIIDADNRPLTDETLKELGFEKDEEYNDWIYHCNNLLNIICNDAVIKSVGYLMVDEDRIAWLGEGRYNMGLKYKTVGSVRMLIEALKGDEE